MLLLIDNFDSFSYMLADLIRQSGQELVVLRNDVSPEELAEIPFKGLILSPGPGKPSEAGNLMQILKDWHDKVPVLGVCLGHQAIGGFFGADLVKNTVPVHGKVHKVSKNRRDRFTDLLPKEFNVTRYHSLQLANLPGCLDCILETECGEIMGISHKTLPILGVQYHPEALLTEFGLELIKNWIWASGLVDLNSLELLNADQSPQYQDIFSNQK
ncbi:aminodeoxychorismate/anthranilate synthase component II [Algoriphagus sp. CAU 1675]|uniref:anthranilate synthase component II n=1 Tax=Algoriphagus sp. CAU 1675 TaxID=3032597 RepID=UPI0023DC3265|nr:aminodeoxychorismate/anthranilate synthase component II [Algoriphagus sp. CAU 1675]MDF2156832.1 aminodeoxychorismate/anthranilate synthase component II [Algoriphagus sp. CAU 1675]